MNPQIVVIDGVQYELATIPQHVLQLMQALGEAQKNLGTKQLEVVTYTHAVISMSQQLKGALSVIPPYVPPAPEEEDADVSED